MLEKQEILVGTRSELEEYFKKILPPTPIEAISACGNYESRLEPIAAQLDAIEAARNRLGAVGYLHCQPADLNPAGCVYIGMVSEFVRIKSEVYAETQV